MGLRRKTQIIITLVLLGLLTALYAVANRTLMVQFSRLEEEQARQNVERVSNAIANELDLLNGSARDDSMWDEAYAFVQHPDPGWGEKNFGEDTYLHLRLNVLIYLNSANEPVFAGEFDSATQQRKPARPELVTSILNLRQSLPPAMQEGSSGIADLAEGQLLMAVWPVVTSVGNAPPRGTLIMARWLNPTELHRLGWTRSLQFDVFPARQLNAKGFDYSALSHLSEISPIYVSNLNQDQIAGYARLKDMRGEPAMLLRVVMPRSVYRQGRATLAYLMLAALIVGLVFTLLNLALLDRMILARLIRLRDAVASIGAPGDLGRRVLAQGNDELAQLGASVNHMLGALEESQKDLRIQARAIEACADGIGILNDRAEFVFLNRAHASIFGYSNPAELIGQSWKILYSSEEVARFEEEVMPSLFHNGHWEGEAVAVRRDGGAFPQQVSLASLAEGGMVCVCRDLTERRQLEEQLQKKQRMEAIGTLAGGVAHDFNNFLTVILGYGQTLLAKVENEPSLRGNVEHIVESASRAASLTRQLLAFSRKQILQPRVLDLNVVVQDLQKMLRPLAGDDVSITTQFASTVSSIKADQSQIEQVIVNLVLNARDAMPAGGRLLLSTANVDVQEKMPAHDRDVPPARYVVLTASDNGVGMNPEILSHIFEPFYTTKGVGKGTGLGLSTVYGIVEQSGGYVSVKSKPGRGTEFNIFFPRVDALPEAAPRERAASRIRQGDETILLVEDDAAVRDLTHDILRSCGYRTLPVAEPKLLESVLRDNPGAIHLLLTDVLMPGCNGREVARQVQKLSPQIKVLYMSGYAFHTMLDRGVLEAGAFFIQKPFTPAQLGEKIRAVLEGESSRASAAP